MNEKNCPICQAPIPEHAPGGFCPACVLRGADEPEPDLSSGPTLDEVAAAFPKLEILRLIGHGGMGYVYQARQPDLDRMVALKILSPALRRDPAFEERFAREARVLGKLKHPNIVTLYEHGESGGYFYLLMEFIDGVNLRQAMSAGRFSPEQALAIVPAICDALQTAHAQGVWHRDIKPENILLDRDGRVKIADFGIARILGDPERNFTLTRTGGLLGSAAYMAPEQHEKPHSVDHRADIYSLGVVIYEMLTGELPLGRFPLPSQRAEVGKRIDEIVLRTLEKERELRQQSANEVKTEVENVATDFSRPLAADLGRSKSTNSNREPRFSRTALVGACWASVAVLHFLVPTLGYRMKSELVPITMSVLALSALIGTTLLGWIAVSQIRRSEGMLHGMWLAVFDGLLFPLMALDLLVMGLPFAAWKLAPGIGSSEVVLLLLEIALLATVIWLDVFIIRRVWRVVNRTTGEVKTETERRSMASEGAAVMLRKKRTWQNTMAKVGGFLLIGAIGFPATQQIVRKYYEIKLSKQIGYPSLQLSDAIGFGFSHPRAKGGGWSIAVPLRAMENWVPDASGTKLTLEDGTDIWVRVKVTKIEHGVVTVEAAISTDRKIWNTQSILLDETHKESTARLDNETRVTARLELVGYKMVSSGNSPKAAIEEFLTAARNRNGRVFESRLSESFKKEIRTEGDDPSKTFGDFGSVEFVDLHMVDEATAEVVVEATDASKRRVTLRMIVENGKWKVTEHGL